MPQREKPTNAIEWYAVKTLYRTIARGRPRSVDANFDQDAVLIEERIVLFRARSFDEALLKAEREAETYARDDPPIVNIYGQRLVTEFLGYSDAFALFDDPAARVEIYSSTQVLLEPTSSTALARAKMIASESKAQDRARRKFLNSEFSQPVG